MTDLKDVTYCGLYCKLCAQRGRIPQQAQALKDAMAAEGYEFFGPAEPKFTAFWDYLTDLCDPQQACPGCRDGGGYPPCEIRACAQQHNVEYCPACPNYPCMRIEEFARVYPTLIVDGLHLRENGLEVWIADQEERVNSGFVYADCRYRQK